MSIADDLDIRVRIRDARRFAADTKNVAKGVDKIGDASKRTQRDAKGAGAALGRLNTVGKRGLKTLVGMAAGYASISAARGAVNTTVDLAKSTLTLNKSFGLSVGLASEWAAIGKVRGAEGKALTMGFKAFATQVRNARIQGGSALKPFKELGISQQELAAHGNDLDSILTLVSDGLGKMPKGTGKAALSAKLFGRTWTAIAPVIREGSDEMRENLKLADKYGATFSGKTLADVEDLIKKQREAKLATLGLQIAFGTLVAPEITKGLSGLAGFFADVRQEAGKNADFGEILSVGLERAVPQVADAAGRAGPKVAAGFLRGFMHAGIWGQVITAGAIAYKLGAFGAAGKIVGRRFAERFAVTAAAESAAAMAAPSGAGSLKGAMGKRKFAWRGAGKVAGAALAAGLIFNFWDDIEREFQDLSGSPLDKLVLPLSPRGYTGGAKPYTPPSGAAPYKKDDRPLRLQQPKRRRTPSLGDRTPHKRASASAARDDLVVPVTVVMDGRPAAKAVARAARIDRLAR